MSELPNWKNVNNWHWVEKNCFDWAHAYLTKVFTTFISSDEDVVIKIKTLKTIEGDANLNVDINYNIQGKTHDKSEKCSGTFSVDDFSGDIKSPKEIFFKLTLDQDTNKNSIFREKFATIMREPFFNMLVRFKEDLEKQGADIFDDVNNIKEASGPASTAYVESGKIKGSSSEKKAPLLKNLSISNDLPVSPIASSPFSTGNISQVEYFMTDPQFLYSILTDPIKIAIWSRSSNIASCGNTVSIGELYQIFDSAVLFRFTSLEFPTIKLDWRFSTWPSNYFSTVEITLSIDDSGRRGTKLVMSQKGIPSDQLDTMKDNWSEYYWKAIRRAFII